MALPYVDRQSRSIGLGTQHRTGGFVALVRIGATIRKVSEESESLLTDLSKPRQRVQVFMFVTSRYIINDPSHCSYVPLSEYDVHNVQGQSCIICPPSSTSNNIVQVCLFNPDTSVATGQKCVRFAEIPGDRDNAKLDFFLFLFNFSFSLFGFCLGKGIN